MVADWPTARVAELEARGYLLVQDGNHGASRPLPHEIVDTGIPHVRAADIKGGSIDFDGAQRVAESAWARIKKGRATGGDVLLTHKGTVGTVAKVPLGVGRMLCSPQTTFWRSLDPNLLDQGFVFAFLRSPIFQDQIQSLMHESDMAPYVSLTNQRGLLMTLPPTVDQRAIASVLAALDEKIESNKRLSEVLLQIITCAFDRSLETLPQQSIALGDLGDVIGGGTPSSSELSFWAL
jgi:type I restriction enzyme S subunit